MHDCGQAEEYYMGHYTIFSLKCRRIYEQQFQRPEKLGQYIKCKKHFIKMLKDVGMVVPKMKETRL